MIKYYAFRFPFSSVRIQESGTMFRITGFCNGQNAGSLTLEPNETEAFMAIITSSLPAVIIMDNGTMVGSMSPDQYLLKEMVAGDPVVVLSEREIREEAESIRLK